MSKPATATTLSRNSTVQFGKHQVTTTSQDYYCTILFGQKMGIPDSLPLVPNKHVRKNGKNYYWFAVADHKEEDVIVFMQLMAFLY